MLGRRVFCSAVTGLAASAFLATSQSKAQDAGSPDTLRSLIVDLSNLGASDGFVFISQYMERGNAKQFTLAHVTVEDKDKNDMPNEAPRIIIGVNHASVSVLGGTSIAGETLTSLMDIGTPQALYHLREWARGHGDDEVQQEIDIVFRRNINPQPSLPPFLNSAFREIEI